MNDPESTIMKRIQLEAPIHGARLLRFNNGLYWSGDTRKISSHQQVHVTPGCVVIYNARPVKTGPPGVSDLLGWTRDGRFLAVEVKSATGRATPEQQNFIEAVRLSGGLATIARSPQDLRAVLLSHHADQA